MEQKTVGIGVGHNGRQKGRFWLVVGALLIVFIAAYATGVACPAPRGDAGSPSTAAAPSLTVAAASDMQFAFEELTTRFKKEAGMGINLVFGSTGLLTQQIEHGAPYDLFAAADVTYLERLADQELIVEGSLALFAQGRIVVAVNRSLGIPAPSLTDLLNPQIRRVSIANPQHAPYGRAAVQALQNSGLWGALQPKLVYGENVRQALQYIQSGGAQAGIVAIAIADVPEITWTLIEPDLHDPLNQGLAILQRSSQPHLAARFSAFVLSPEGQRILQRYGFLPPPNNP